MRAAPSRCNEQLSAWPESNGRWCRRTAVIDVLDVWPSSAFLSLLRQQLSERVVAASSLSACQPPQRTELLPARPMQVNSQICLTSEQPHLLRLI